MHASSPDGKHSMCMHTGQAAEPKSADLSEVDCSSCLWALVRLLLVQWGETLKRLHAVERNRTIKGG